MRNHILTSALALAAALGKPGSMVCAIMPERLAKTEVRAPADGLVLARSGFNHSANYRSAMCFGTAQIVDDPAEKMQQLHAVTDRFFPNRARSLRAITPQEAKATMVIKMRIEEASAKVRDAGVGDEDEDLGLPIWAGVIPVETVIRAATDKTHTAGSPRPFPRGAGACDQRRLPATKSQLTRAQKDSTYFGRALR